MAMGKGEFLMWTYNKILEYPINIKQRNPELAKFIISQYGGPDGELGASLRYLSQRFDMPDQKAKAILRSDFETIEQVALSVGYNSIYHFSKMFKVYSGISPLEYSKQNRHS